MAQIRQFHTNNNEKSTDIENKISRHRMKKRYLILIAIVIILVFILLLKINSETKKYSEYEAKSSVDWSVSADATCRLYNGNILTYSIDGASCTDAKGKSLWNITYQMQNPIVEINGSFVAIGDYNGNVIYVLNEKGKQGEISTNLPIKKFAVSGNGYVITVLDNGSSTPIYLYDSVGTEYAFFRTTMENSGYPMDVTISENGEVVGVYYMKLDTNLASVGYSATVAFYNFGSIGEDLGDNFLDSYTYDSSMIGMFQSIGNDTFIAISESNMYLYKGKHKPTISTTIPIEEEIRSVFYNNQYIALVFDDTSGESEYRIDVYDMNGKKTGSIKTNQDYDDIIFCNGRIMVYNDQECSLYTMKGEIKYQGTFDSKVVLVIPSSSYTKYHFVSKEKIDMVELR